MHKKQFFKRKSFFHSRIEIYLQSGILNLRYRKIPMCQASTLPRCTFTVSINNIGFIYWLNIII
ncbi:hypothetical protein A2699_02095 [Candidatus Gottesmanbacteria bacterium RIFCSPHIGHO2_01_FULL_43_15]|nr:MAG: hypothetical protein A2699_02095 [Candidatus Gottesmanbacteria bacterium RIFCSPHIGHO2_01_FULL_43_15]